MKYVEEYLKNVIKIKPLGELTTKEETIGDLSGEVIYIDGKCIDIFVSHADYINWIEKHREIDKASYEIAEKEKNDFVSGQFIECRKSFDVFKEDNSYWFEYVGNDTYIGRSDNILNQKFHITPRQLYRLFTQQHRPKENNVNEEANAPTAYGKYVDECLDEAAKHFFSEGEDKYSVADLFYAGVRCGKSWLEKQGQTFTKKDVDDAYLKGICDAKQELEKQWEKEPIDNIESKFKVGDWIVFNGLVLFIKEVPKGYYRTISFDGIPNSYDWDIDRIARYWTIRDAKGGDVLVFDDDAIVMLKDLYGANSFRSYCYVEEGAFSVSDDDIPDWWKTKGIHPATKEQCDTLMKAMADAGWEFDFEKKELKKIEHWSGKDEANFQCVLSYVNSNPLLEDVNVENCISWLKSIKDRLEQK